MTRLIKTLWLLCLFPLLGICNPLVYSQVGPIEGKSENGIESFLGIPYGVRPAGELRFAPPKKAEPFSSVYKAVSYCPVAPQREFSSASDHEHSARSYLCLNIQRPKGTKESMDLPVYVFIHGGAYVGGSSNMPLYEGSAFARDGIIFVSINYRLGAEGFFASNTTRNLYGTTGNWGHLDMLMALKWVKENIRHFGGDPENITVGGHSAGAFSVSMFLLSPLAQGLFSKAILNSGTMISHPFYRILTKDRERFAKEQSDRFALIFDAQDNPEGLEMLRSIDETLMSYNCSFDYDFVHNRGNYLVPYPDTYLMPSSPYKALCDHEFNEVDVLMGYVSDEGALFVPENLTDRDFEQGLYANYPEVTADNLMQVYKHEGRNLRERICLYASDTIFNLGMKIFADKMSEKRKVYLYHFNYRNDDDRKRKKGVYHGSELKYLFSKLPMNASNTDKDISEIFHMRVVNFIKTGNPNTDGENQTLISWPLYNIQDRAVLKIDVFSGIEKLEDYERLNSLEQIFFYDDSEDEPVPNR